ncbi:MAG: hypothetical protein ACI3XT_05370, partial [Butyricicoccaceae bacterium]
APPCQGGGSEFEPRNPLQQKISLWADLFYLPSKPALRQTSFYEMFFHGHVPGKNTVPAVFPQKNGETGPQAGIPLSKKTQRSGFLTASSAFGLIFFICCPLPCPLLQ